MPSWRCSILLMRVEWHVLKQNLRFASTYLIKTDVVRSCKIQYRDHSFKHIATILCNMLPFNIPSRLVLQFRNFKNSLENLFSIQAFNVWSYHLSFSCLLFDRLLVLLHFHCFSQFVSIWLFKGLIMILGFSHFSCFVILFHFFLSFLIFVSFLDRNNLPTNRNISTYGQERHVI